MFNQSYDSSSLMKHFFSSDFKGIGKKSRDSYQTFVTQLAIEKLEKIDCDIPIRKIIVRKKAAFKIDDDPYRLIMRKTCSNLRFCSDRPIIQNRRKIIKNLKILLAEGVPYRAYRLDIKDFYESFSKKTIDDALSDINNLSPVSRFIIDSALSSCRSLGCKGLPRGLGISAVLSEIMIKKFDDSVVSLRNVYFYARYVDDILIMTSGEEVKEEFLSSLSKKLPEGLVFNMGKKFKVISLSSDSTSQIQIKSKTKNDFFISYLGYEFCIKSEVCAKQELFGKKPQYRKIVINVSTEKINKIKNRLVKALICYAKNPCKNEELLLVDRIKYLTGNFKVSDKKLFCRRKSGLLYNYPLISKDLESLKNLDGFLKSIVSLKGTRFGRNFLEAFNGKIKRKLLANSFVRFYEKEVFFRFSDKRILQIKRCWING